MNIVLIGFMCSGKSKVGRLLAKRLGWTQCDTDEMIQRQERSSVAEIITQKGEAVFREIEKNIVAQVSKNDRCVISTGGGVPLDPKNMEALTRHGEVVWLKVSPETVLARAGDLKSRPLIDPNDPLGSIRKRMTEREKVYAAAKHVIEADGLEPEDVAEKILSFIPSARL